MNIIKSKANAVQFILDPDKIWTRIDIIVGENFRTLEDNSFLLNITPLTDATLVPFNNFKIENHKTLSLDVNLKNSLSKYQIDLSKHKAGPLLAAFIEKYDTEGYNIKTSYANSIKIEIDKRFFKFQFEDISFNDSDIENKKWLIVSRNKYGSYVQIKEPFVSQKRYEQIKKVELKGDLLTVECAGKDVWDESSDELVSLFYNWKLNIQPEFSEIVGKLLSVCIGQLKDQ